MQNYEIIKKIKAYINQRGITQAEFARRAKIRPDKLWRILTINQAITDDVKNKIETVLVN